MGVEPADLDPPPAGPHADEASPKIIGIDLAGQHGDEVDVHNEDPFAAIERARIKPQMGPGERMVENVR
ncbi:hypothetical protein PUR21_31080 [Methylorubrum rhodesianum]|uniref:Transposase n=1 Tax=Methylorubrum rhodesianum TaxID=29427 RepID=A0ABU9ZMX2_9HYPH